MLYNHRDPAEIERLKDSATTAKNRLMDIMNDLYHAGAIREAGSLGTIIGKLEDWQNK